MNTETPIRPVRVHIAMKDGPLPMSIKRVLSVIGNEEMFAHVDDMSDADLVLFTDVRAIENGFVQEKSYALVDISGSKSKQALPNGVTVLSANNPLVDLINLIDSVDQIFST